MPTIKHETYIAAPIHVCYDLARTVEIHAGKSSLTTQKAIDGTTDGLMEIGDWVTWETKHLGITQTLTSQVIKMEKPNSFTDVMSRGIFHSFTHTHEFSRQGEGTIMNDTFAYIAPFGILGKIADRLFLENYMRSFISIQAKKVKKAAESKKY